MSFGRGVVIPAEGRAQRSTRFRCVIRLRRAVRLRPMSKILFFLTRFAFSASFLIQR